MAKEHYSVPLGIAATTLIVEQDDIIAKQEADIERLRHQRTKLQEHVRYYNALARELANQNEALKVRVIRAEETIRRAQWYYGTRFVG